MTSSSSSGALEAVERILNRGGDTDAVLQQVVDVLQERTAAWVEISFESKAGPRAGGPTPDNLQRHAIVSKGRQVAELRVSVDADPALCARVAVLVTHLCG